MYRKPPKTNFKTINNFLSKSTVSSENETLTRLPKHFGIMYLKSLENILKISEIKTYLNIYGGDSLRWLRFNFY